MIVPNFCILQSRFGTKTRNCRANLQVNRENTPCGSRKIFTDHPASVHETYFGHMAFAAWFASRLFMAAGAALVHAILPFLFETTASRIVRELYERTSRR